MSPGCRHTPQAAGRISRRRLLAAGGLAASLLAVGAGRAGAQTSAPKATVVGRSQGGQPILAYHLGGDRRRVLAIGGQHGAPEANAVTTVDAILDHFWHYETSIPKGVGLDVITIANPDGYLANSRQYLSGVDPNRNWASGDWEPDAYDSLGRYTTGLGGPAPMSEPETREIAAWIARRHPTLVINYHSAGGFVSTDQDGLSWELGEVYADASGYPCYGPDAPFGYPITGARMVSMDNGPVLSELYSRITWGDDAESPWTDWISRKGPYQLSVRREDRQFLQLSEYDEEVLAGVLDKFGRWDAATLTRYTHALPEWRDPDGCALAIDLRLILQDAGKSDAEIHSIASQVESIWAMRRSQSLVG